MHLYRNYYLHRAEAESDLRSEAHELGRRKLVGSWTCSAEGSSLAHFSAVVTALGAVTERRMLRAPKTSWQISLYVLPSGAAVALAAANGAAYAAREAAERARDSTFRDDVARFRRAVAEGDRVGVPFHAMPSEVTRVTSPYSKVTPDRVFLACGLALEVRPALVRVQVDGAAFFVRREQVYPPRTPALGDITAVGCGQ